MTDVSPIWLLSGVPGAGKTTVAAALCRRYARCIHIPVDDLREWVCAGLATPLDWTDETERQFRLARRAAAHIATLYSSDGFAVVLDDVLRERDLAMYADHLHGRPLRKVLLAPSLEVVLRRKAERTHKAFDTAVLRPAILSLHEILALECTRAAGWLVVDTTALTADETANVLLSEV